MQIFSSPLKISISDGVETLRNVVEDIAIHILYSIHSFIHSFVAKKDCELAGYRIPKGAMVVPVWWAMNLDPNLWPQPLEFRPERFLSPDGRSVIKPDAFMPFQCGRRMCIGDQLGRTIIFLFTVTLLQRFRLSFPAGFDYDLDRMTPEYGFTLVPRPYPVALNRR